MAYNSNMMHVFLQSITDDRELERRLDIVQSQINAAFEQNDHAALENLQDHERLIIDRRVNILDDIPPHHEQVGFHEDGTPFEREW